MIETFRRRLSDAIEREKIAMKPLSRKAGLGERAVNDMLNGGDKGPNLSGVIAVAKALGVSVAYLVGETDDPSAAPEMPALDALPLSVSEAATAVPFEQWVHARIPTHEAGTVGFLLTGPQALHLAKHLERAEERLSSEPAPSAASS